jgi:hypothetical protein
VETQENGTIWLLQLGRFTEPSRPVTSSAFGIFEMFWAKQLHRASTSSHLLTSKVAHLEMKQLSHTQPPAATITHRQSIN